MNAAAGKVTVEVVGRLDEAARAALHAALGAVVTDEETPRAGWGWLAPDRRVTISAGDGDGPHRLTVWEVGAAGTDGSWVAEQLTEALAQANLTCAVDLHTTFS